MLLISQNAILTYILVLNVLSLLMSLVHSNCSSLSFNCRWTDSQSDCQTKLSFQAFLEAFMCIARRSKLRSPNVLEMVQNLLDYCEANLQYSSKTTLRRAKLPRIPVRHNYRQPSSRLGKHTPCPNSLDSG